MHLYRYLDLLPFVQVDPPATIRQQSTRSELTVATVVRSGHNLISNVGLFDIACREWRTKATVDEAMAALQMHFHLGDQARRQHHRQ
jgi:hypothetical protein